MNDTRYRNNNQFLVAQENVKFYLKYSKKIDKKNQQLWLIFAGILIGLLNGFFGGGGGMICVPILQKVLDLDAKSSHATAIMIIFPISIISMCIYIVNGYLDFYPFLTVSIGVVVGGILGAFALKILPSKTVKIIFAIIMFAGGIKLII